MVPEDIPDGADTNSSETEINSTNRANAEENRMTQRGRTLPQNTNEVDRDAESRARLSKRHRESSEPLRNGGRSTSASSRGRFQRNSYSNIGNHNSNYDENAFGRNVDNFSSRSSRNNQTVHNGAKNKIPKRIPPSLPPLHLPPPPLPGMRGIGHGNLEHNANFNDISSRRCNLPNRNSQPQNYRQQNEFLHSDRIPPYPFGMNGSHRDKGTFRGNVQERGGVNYDSSSSVSSGSSNNTFPDRSQQRGDSRQRGRRGESKQSRSLRSSRGHTDDQNQHACNDVPLDTVSSDSRNVSQSRNLPTISALPPSKIPPLLRPFPQMAQQLPQLPQMPLPGSPPRPRRSNNSNESDSNFSIRNFNPDTIRAQDGLGYESDLSNENASNATADNQENESTGTYQKQNGWIHEATISNSISPQPINSRNKHTRGGKHERGCDRSNLKSTNTELENDCQEELALAQLMNLPVNIEIENGPTENSHLNPRANEFAPRAYDAFGKLHDVFINRGIHQYLSKSRSNPEFVISTTETEMSHLNETFHTPHPIQNANMHHIPSIPHNTNTPNTNQNDPSLHAGVYPFQTMINPSTVQPMAAQYLPNPTNSTSYANSSHQIQNIHSVSFHTNNASVESQPHHRQTTNVQNSSALYPNSQQYYAYHHQDQYNSPVLTTSATNEQLESLPQPAPQTIPLVQQLQQLQIGPQLVRHDQIINQTEPFVDYNTSHLTEYPTPSPTDHHTTQHHTGLQVGFQTPQSLPQQPTYLTPLVSNSPYSSLHHTLTHPPNGPPYSPIPANLTASAQPISPYSGVPILPLMPHTIPQTPVSPMTPSTPHSIPTPHGHGGYFVYGPPESYPQSAAVASHPPAPVMSLQAYWATFETDNPNPLSEVELLSYTPNDASDRINPAVKMETITKKEANTAAASEIREICGKFIKVVRRYEKSSSDPLSDTALADKLFRGFFGKKLRSSTKIKEINECRKNKRLDSQGEEEDNTSGNESDHERPDKHSKR